ncbi:hypothetical protein HDC30_005798 [Pseudomonas sp. JAI115]|nr:hypothetical protein [Pseudomonas sp. JAI115]
MSIIKATVLVYSVMTKDSSDAGARLDKCSAEISSYRLFKALCLGLYDSHKVKVGITFSMKIHIYSVQHHCAPLAAYMA